MGIMSRWFSLVSSPLPLASFPDLALTGMSDSAIESKAFSSHVPL